MKPNSESKPIDLSEEHRQLANLFWWVFVISLGFVAAATIAAAVCWLYPFPTTIEEKLITARLALVGLGLVFAIVQIFLGVLLALVGITSPFDLDAGAGGSKVKLVSASPGILLIVAGNLLFCFTLMRQISLTMADSSQDVSGERLQNESPSTGQPIKPEGEKGP